MNKYFKDYTITSVTDPTPEDDPTTASFTAETSAEDGTDAAGISVRMLADGTIQWSTDGGNTWKDW